METLIKIQNELKVPKGNLNKFGNYKYRSAEDILEAVKPLLLKHSAILLLSDDIQQIGNKIFLKATAIIEAKGEVRVSNGFAETSEHKGMSAEQTTGTASSYARKYALNGLFLIDETESDADSREPVKDPKKEAETLLSSATSIEDLQEKYLSFSVEMRKLTANFTAKLKEKLTIKPVTA